jgi:CubicO group peptidase (beta-lactamase class C family)
MPGLEQKVEQCFQSLEDKGFSGAVLVVKDTQAIIHKACGLADMEKNVPNTLETVFDIGSISKQFTATAILQLELQGLLNVYDRIARFLPNAPADKAGITIHQLLTHTAGLDHDHSAGDMVPQDRTQALESIFSMPLLSRPGTKYSYSNTGFSVAGIILELITGISFPAYAHEYLFKPAGMTHSGFYSEPHWKGIPMAHTYEGGKPQGLPAEWPGPYWGVLANGGVLSTVGEMYGWWQALQNHILLPPAQTNKLFTPYFPCISRYIRRKEGLSFYGYGWRITDTQRGRVIEHSGGGMGGNSQLTALVDLNVFVMVSSNHIGVDPDAKDDPLTQRPATEACRLLVEKILDK